MSGFVYFIGGKDWRLSRVKIGTTRVGPLNRLSSLQTGSPFPLTLYGYVSGGADFERLLHETFEPLRLHGEWFRNEGKLLALVGHLTFEGEGRETTLAHLAWAVSDIWSNAEAPHEVLDRDGLWGAHNGGLADWARRYLA
jgi:hypothetical protein